MLTALGLQRAFPKPENLCHWGPREPLTRCHRGRECRRGAARAVGAARWPVPAVTPQGHSAGSWQSRAVPRRQQGLPHPTPFSWAEAGHPPGQLPPVSVPRPGSLASCPRSLSRETGSRARVLLKPPRTRRGQLIRKSVRIPFRWVRLSRSGVRAETWSSGQQLGDRGAGGAQGAEPGASSDKCPPRPRGCPRSSGDLHSRAVPTSMARAHLVPCPAPRGRGAFSLLRKQHSEKAKRTNKTTKNSCVILP